jgi:23S rRNA pseudouridine2457 synthase
LPIYISGMHNPAQWHCILFYKPYGVLSQFTGDPGQHTLAEYGPFPGDVYAAGRLDADSEGLLILTNDHRVQQRLTDPAFGHPRTYCAQVENVPSAEALALLRTGVTLDGRRTLPADVRLLTEEPRFPARPVPIRSRKSIPTAWIEITLREGRNRQVRRMTALVGFPTLRLVRTSIGVLKLTGLAPGEARELTRNERDDLLRSLRLTHRGG